MNYTFVFLCYLIGSFFYVSFMGHYLQKKYRYSNHVTAMLFFFTSYSLAFIIHTYADLKIMSSLFMVTLCTFSLYEGTTIRKISCATLLIASSFMALFLGTILLDTYEVHFPHEIISIRQIMYIYIFMIVFNGLALLGIAKVKFIKPDLPEAYRSFSLVLTMNTLLVFIFSVFVILQHMKTDIVSMVFYFPNQGFYQPIGIMIFICFIINNIYLITKLVRLNNDLTDEYIIKRINEENLKSLERYQSDETMSLRYLKHDLMNYITVIKNRGHHDA